MAEQWGPIPGIKGPPALPKPPDPYDPRNGTWGGVWGNAPIYGRNAGGFDATRYFGTPSEVAKLFWQSQAGMPYAFDQFARTEAPDANSTYGRWLAAQEGNVVSDYANASLNNVNLQYTDYLASRAQGLAQKYTELPGWQRGQSAPVNSAGRRL